MTTRDLNGQIVDLYFRPDFISPGVVLKILQPDQTLFIGFVASYGDTQSNVLQAHLRNGIPLENFDRWQLIPPGVPDPLIHDRDRDTYSHTFKERFDRPRSKKNDQWER